jgi:septin family protein
MVAGARGTGKTSLLKLFLDTSEISSTATPEQKLSVESFMSKSRKSTRKLQTACAEIAESRFDRILLTLVDTPGLAFDDGQELVLERSVSALVKYLDMQYNESMGEASNSNTVLSLGIELTSLYRNQKSFVKTKETNMFICKQIV